MSGVDEILSRFVKRMTRACDRTKAHKAGVVVDQIDWHGLMDLAEMAKAALARPTPPSTPVEPAAPTFNETGDALKVERIAAALVTVERAEHGLPPMRFDMLTKEAQAKYRNRARFALATLTKDASHG